MSLNNPVKSHILRCGSPQAKIITIIMLSLNVEPCAYTRPPPPPYEVRGSLKKCVWEGGGGSDLQDPWVYVQWRYMHVHGTCGLPAAGRRTTRPGGAGNRIHFETRKNAKKKKPASKWVRAGKIWQAHEMV